MPWIFTEKAWVCRACRRAVSDDSMPLNMNLDCVCTQIPDQHEQRRYEIARDAFAFERAAFNAAFNNDYNDEVGARDAVRAADALLAALEESK